MRELTEEILSEDIARALKATKRKVDTFKGMIKRFHSPFFKDGLEPDDDEDKYAPENHYFEYVGLNLPKLAMGVPKVKLAARTWGTEGAIAELRNSLDQWTIDVDLKNFNGHCATDFFFDYCVGYLTLEDHPDPWLSKAEVDGKKKKAKRVAIERVAPDMFFRDADATAPDDYMLLGHEWSEYKDVLQGYAEDGDTQGIQWDSEAIEATSDINEANETNNVRARAGLYTVWLSDFELEEDNEWDAVVPKKDKDQFNGTIFILGKQTIEKLGTSYIPVATPFAYRGPKTGPYVIGDAYFVPGHSEGLSPLLAVEGQIRDLNTSSRTIKMSEDRYKKLVFVASDDEDLAQKVKDSEHDSVISVDPETAKVWGAEVGGTTEQLQMSFSRRKDQLDRTSGMMDAQRGAATSGATATENMIADQASDIRIDYVKERFEVFLSRIYKVVAWYHYYLPEIRHVLGPEAAKELNKDLQPGERLVFQGGDYAEHMTFEELSIDISPYTVGRTSEGLNQQRAMQLFQVITQVGAAVVQMPWVEWTPLLEMLGQAFNWPNLSELIKEDQAQQQSQVLQQQQQQNAQNGSGRQNGQQGGTPAGQPNVTAGANVLQRKQYRDNPLEGNQNGGDLAAMVKAIMPQ